MLNLDKQKFIFNKVAEVWILTFYLKWIDWDEYCITLPCHNSQMFVYQYLTLRTIEVVKNNY